jgi:hypothetical protein
MACSSPAPSGTDDRPTSRGLRTSSHSGALGSSVADRLRRFVKAESSDDGRRHYHPPIKRRQDVLVLDQNQVLQRRCVGDDNHSAGRLKG